MPESVRTARRYVLERVEGRDPEVVADALLLTSELCTNCVVHAKSDYWVRVSVDERVRVEVGDQHPERPRMRSTGRGLQLVDDLAVAWGVDDVVAGPGKIVWFEVP